MVFALFQFIFIIVLIIIMVFGLICVSARINALQKQVIELKRNIHQIKDHQIESIEKNEISSPSSDPKQTPATTVDHQRDTVAEIVQIAEPEVAESQPTVSFAAVAAEQEPTKISHKEALFAQTPAPAPHGFSHWFKSLVTDNLISKVAIIILFFGLSYLFKYSIDHQLLSPQVRVLGTFVFGIGMLFTGWYLKDKKTIYAMILQGGALGIIYITVFAAFKLYDLIPYLLALVALVIICALCVYMALVQRTKSLAILACIGGYLAPVLLSSHTINHTALFSYYLAISSAILVISIWQSWRVLNLIGFLFTFFVSLIWGTTSFRSDYFAECEFFILGNMLIYGILAVILSIRSLTKERHQHMIDLILLFGTPLAAFALQYAITKHWEYGPAISAFAFGLFYLVGSYICLHFHGFISKIISQLGLAIGLSFITLSIALAFSLEWTSLIWLFEGTALTWVMLNQKQSQFARFGALINMLAFVTSFYSVVITHFTLTQYILFNGFVSISLLLNACLWHHYLDQNESAKENRLTFILMACVVWVFWILSSINRLSITSDERSTLICLCFTVAVWLWYFIGKKIKWDGLCYAFLSLWPVLFLSLTVYAGTRTNDFLLLHLLCDLVWICAFISGFTYLNIAKKIFIRSSQGFYLFLHISLFWITLYWIFDQAKYLLNLLQAGFSTIEFSVLLSISSMTVLIINTLLKKKLMGDPKTIKAYVCYGLIPIVLHIYLSLISGLFKYGQIDHWPYIPLINPLEISAIFAILMLGVWFNLCANYKTYRDSNNIKQPISNFAFWVMIVFSFLWANSMILRCLSQWLNVQWTLGHLWNSKIIQATLSLIWAFAGVLLISIGHRFAQRKTWFTGMIIQLAVVIKLFLVDSMELEGLLRAAAFIIIALLMLFIGYLAPLPPKTHKTDQSYDE